MLDLIRGFRVLQVDLAFPHLFPIFHPQNLPNFAPDLTSPRGVHPRIPSPDIRPDQLGHPARPGHPAKNCPNFFVICWCDEVLLDLIRGFRVLQVDLAFPHLFPIFHPQNLPNFAPDLTSPRGVHPRIPSPDIRPDQLGHPARPGHPAISPDIRPLTASTPSSTPFTA